MKYIQLKITVNDELIDDDVEKTLDVSYEAHIQDWVQFVQDSIDQSLITKDMMLVSDNVSRTSYQYFETLSENAHAVFQVKINEIEPHAVANTLIELNSVESIPSEHRENGQHFTLGIEADNATDNDTGEFIDSEENQ
jgi:hypothetical protein